MKLVSVIIPYYKKKKFFPKTLKSILNQTYKNLEIIIIYDDCDVDELLFLKRLINKHKRIKILVNKTNLGAGLSRNKGIKYSKGRFIAFIDADDIWSRVKIEEQLKFMIKNNYAATHTNYKIINEKDQIIGIQKSTDILSFENLIKSCDIGLSTVMIDKLKIIRNTKFPSLKTKEDFIFWLRLLKKGVYFKSYNQDLVYWRKNKNSLSSSIIQKLKDGFLVYNRYLGYSTLKSFYYLTILSVNSVFKKIRIYL